MQFSSPQNFVRLTAAVDRGLHQKKLNTHPLSYGGKSVFGDGTASAFSVFMIMDMAKENKYKTLYSEGKKKKKRC